MKFLIDECLHTSLVDVANERGHEAYHVVYRAMAGRKDWELMMFVREGDYTFVTQNAVDFRRLYEGQPSHTGLILIVPQVVPAVQRQLFDAMLAEIGDGQLVNTVLEINLDGNRVIFTTYEFPPA